MNIENLTKEQKAELKRQLEAEEKAEKARVQQERENYKSIVDAWVEDKVKKLQNVSSILMTEKADIFATAQTIIDMKDDLFKAKSDRKSDTFSTSDGTKTIRIGNRINEGWDDTVNAGVDKVKTFIRSLAKDDDSAALTEMVMNLLAKDRKGNLKASRVLQLREIARKSGYPELIEATDIIQSAYRPVDSCQFISVSYKDEKGVKRALPLSLAAME